MKAPKTWVLVADAGAAIVYANTGETDAHHARLTPVPAGNFKRDDRRRHFGSPPDTGIANARGDAHHGVGSHEKRERLAETQFLEEVLAWLDQPAQLACFENLIIAAPPRALGELRAGMSSALQCKLSHEIHADLTKSPIKEIESHVLSHLIPISVAAR
ncbi:MAG: host attachment protein [Beijerinckiaceae bacterium]